MFQLIGTSRETINRTLSEFSYVLFLGNALVLVVFLDPSLDGVLFVHDADAPNYLSGNAIAPAAPQKEICRRRDHKRGIRRAADQTHARCKFEIGISTWIQPTTIHSECGYGESHAYGPPVVPWLGLHVPSRLHISMKWSANSV
jgi:hypothetical protein